MWPSVVNILLGFGVIGLTAIFDIDRDASNNYFITGPLIITFATIALWDVNRNAAKFNTLAGVWLLLTPFFFSLGSETSIWVNSGLALAIIIMSLIPHKLNHNYGGGWISLFQKSPDHLNQAQKNRRIIK